MDPVVSLEGLKVSGGGVRISVREFGDEELATPMSSVFESQTERVLRSSGSSEWTTERWGFQRPELRLARGGRVGADKVVSAHDPEAVGGRTTGY